MRSTDVLKMRDHGFVDLPDAVKGEYSNRGISRQRATD
ncbi:hypothetical protein C4K39_2956 [Pseudomonas sessilinigenes]|nr:hypothetical protein C4K39_2956 [Pseudomonas sessilinigenes]